ncbi:MAG: DUF2796 domain-containing protein [Roseobacter sp.]
MKTLNILVLSTVAASPAFAQGTRQLDAHEHGVGQLDIALQGTKIAMEFHAPGADIVGFEHPAESAEDRASVDAAVAILSKPLDLFVIPAAAGCSVVQASAELESEEAHEDHDAHEDHEHDDHDEHDDDEHAHEDHDDHDDEKHAHEDHDEHADHEDEEHGHDDHAEEAGHTEFHAEYLLDCADPAALSDITFAYFDVFPNALEVEVQLVSDTGATSFEVERDTPVLDLSDQS